MVLAFILFSRIITKPLNYLTLSEVIFCFIHFRVKLLQNPLEKINEC
jgi:hypothetical protein